MKQGPTHADDGADDERSGVLDPMVAWGALSAEIHNEDDPVERSEFRRLRRRLGYAQALMVLLGLVSVYVRLR